MAGRDRIHILRGTNTKIANSIEKLSPGQLLYNLDKKYITVGDNTGDTAVNSLPINVRKVEGWFEDNNNITSNQNDNKYIIEPDDDGLIINSKKELNLIGETSLVLRGSEPSVNINLSSNILINSPNEDITINGNIIPNTTEVNTIGNINKKYDTVFTNSVSNGDNFITISKIYNPTELQTPKIRNINGDTEVDGWIKKATTSDKLNNIQTLNGRTLEIGDLVIPYKKLLWSGNSVANTGDYTSIDISSFNLPLDAILEIEYIVHESADTSFSYTKLKANPEDSYGFDRSVKSILGASHGGLPVLSRFVLVLFFNEEKTKLNSVSFNGTQFSSSESYSTTTITKIYQIIE